eukprot:755786-Hanusia_phi.AAC.2
MLVPEIVRRRPYAGAEEAEACREPVEPQPLPGVDAQVCQQRALGDHHVGQEPVVHHHRHRKVHHGSPGAAVGGPGIPGEHEGQAPERAAVLEDREAAVRAVGLLVNDPAEERIIDGVPNGVDDMDGIEGGGRQLDHSSEEDHGERAEKTADNGRSKPTQSKGHYLPAHSSEDHRRGTR